MNVQQHLATGGAITEGTIASSVEDVSSGRTRIIRQVDFDPDRDRQYILHIGIGDLSSCYVTVEGSEQILEHTSIRHEGGGQRTYPGVVYALANDPHVVPTRVEGSQQLTIEPTASDDELDWKFTIGDGSTQGGVAKISSMQYHVMANLFGSLKDGYPFDEMKGIFDVEGGRPQKR